MRPGLLEYPPGPWAEGTSTGKADPLRGWKRALDWMSDQGLNVVIAELPLEEKGEVRQGWGYHYILDFDNHPEARVFGKEFTRRNREILTAISSHAKSKGIDLFLHHYNFLAPYNYVVAHDALSEKQRFMLAKRGGRAFQDWTGFLMGHVCWNDPEYRAFLRDCVMQTLEACPGLAGMMVTAGECANCLCPECSKAVIESNGRNRNEKMRADFLHAFRDWIAEAGKRGLVRAWQVEKALSLFPRDGLTYILKQTVFDCMNAGPDPVVETWQKAGFDVWTSKEIYGENAGPIVWFDPAYIHRQVQDARNLGVPGMMCYHNTQRSFLGMEMPVQQLNFLAYCLALQREGAEYDPEPWNQTFRETYGEDGLKILEAMQQAAGPVLTVSRIYFTPNEGHSFDHFHDMCLYPDGHRIGAENTRPPEWARGDIEAIQDYVERIGGEGWSERLLSESLAPRKRNPIATMAEVADLAHKGVETLERLCANYSGDQYDNVRIAALGGRVAWQLGLEWVHIYRALLLYKAAERETDLKRRRALAQRCVAEVNASAHAVRRQMETLLEYPPHLIEPLACFQVCSAIQVKYTASIRERWEHKRREVIFIKEKFELELTEMEQREKMLSPLIDKTQNEIYISRLRSRK